MALSYCWGSPDDKREIMVDNEPRQVTVNLESALRHIRDYLADRQPTCLWVDAVCINQDDAKEKKCQIPLMRDIYAAASRVLVWLGEGDHETDWLLRQCNDPAFVNEVARKKDVELRAAKIMRYDIRHRPWWFRVWIIQELAVARQDPVVVCGRSATFWSALAQLNDNLQDAGALVERFQTPSGNDILIPLVPAYNENATASVESLNLLRQQFQEFKSVLPMTIVSFSVQATATDAQDHVYGLLGLLDGKAAGQIGEYGRDEREAFRDLALLLYREYAKPFLRGTLTLINFAPPDKERPSWVPYLCNQLSSKDRRPWSSLGLVGHTGGLALRDPDLEISIDKNMIRFRGLELDVVSNTLKFGRVSSSLSAKRLLEAEERISKAHSRPIPKSHRMSRDGEARKRFQQLKKEDTLDILSVSKYHPGLKHTTKAERDLFWRILTQKVPEGKVPEEAIVQEPRYWKAVVRYLWDSVCRRIDGRTLLISEAGFAGVGVPDVKKGDVIAFIFGMPCPIILRESSDSNGHVFVGIAYVSGFMDVNEVQMDYDAHHFKGMERDFYIY